MKRHGPSPPLTSRLCAASLRIPPSPRAQAAGWLHVLSALHPPTSHLQRSPLTHLCLPVVAGRQRPALHSKAGGPVSPHHRRHAQAGRRRAHQLQKALCIGQLLLFTKLPGGRVFGRRGLELLPVVRDGEQLGAQVCIALQKVASEDCYLREAIRACGSKSGALHSCRGGMPGRVEAGWQACL
jgi:hypothetical protein